MLARSYANEFRYQISCLSTNKKTSLGWFFYLVLRAAYLLPPNCVNDHKANNTTATAVPTALIVAIIAIFSSRQNQIEDNNKSSRPNRSTIFCARKGFLIVLFAMKSQVTLLLGFCRASSLSLVRSFQTPEMFSGSYQLEASVSEIIGTGKNA